MQLTIPDVEHRSAVMAGAPLVSIPEPKWPRPILSADSETVAHRCQYRHLSPVPWQDARPEELVQFDFDPYGRCGCYVFLDENLQYATGAGLLLRFKTAVAATRAARVGAMKPGRCAIRNPMRLLTDAA